VNSTTASYVSVSEGVALQLRRRHLSAQQLITDADRNLFEVKRLGRNRMVVTATEAA
jgi:GGDEF domain-containing protein